MRSIETHITSAAGLWTQAEKPGSILHSVFAIRKQLDNGRSFASVWQQQCEKYRQQHDTWQQQQSQQGVQHWDLTDSQDYKLWFASGTGLPNRPQPAGEFAVASDGDAALVGIYPSGVYSHAVSQKHAARLTSADFTLGTDQELWVQVIGDTGASVRYVVQDYPRNGTVYPVTKLAPRWNWQRYDLSYWDGDNIHIELTTAKDAPLLVDNQPRSWFGIRRAMVLPKGQANPVNTPELPTPVFEAAARTPPQELSELAAIYATAVSTAIDAWKDNSATDAQALLLDACLRQGLLTNQLKKLPSAQPLVAEYRRLEQAIPIPTRVPGLDEAHVKNQPLFERGNHKLPGDEVPRRFLEAIDATPYASASSGRLELAEDLLRDDNPLTRRVLVNRVWHHLFGQGIVSTPDNFGRLGAEPTHPELLDWLANRFVEDGWSLRKLIRLIVTSRTWQLSSEASPQALIRDPENRLLTHASVRRMEAEAIRDQLLTVSGRIDHQMAGAPVPGTSARRSVYVRVQRNALDPFLRVFDFPEPFTTVGRRDVTNVPAQSLTMLNDTRISAYATDWAQRLNASETAATAEERIQEMFLTAFCRPATDVEAERCRQYLTSTQERILRQRQHLTSLKQKVAGARNQINDLKAPVRQRLTEELMAGKSKPKLSLPVPIAGWDFSESTDDQVGPANGELRSGAVLSDGGLAVRSGGYVITQPLQTDLTAKTLEAWVQLDNLQQRAGGVITVQTPNGVFFDAIVFAERNPGEWLAGSNGFSRTRDFGGPTERNAADNPVHIAVVYSKDGKIAGYRDGQPYGQPYQSNGPYHFRAGQTIVGFGVRHLPAGGNRMLSGRILKAAVYDRALSAEEIAATASGSAHFVSEKRVLAALSLKDRQKIDLLNRQIATLETEIEQLGKVPAVTSDVVLWTELARAIFTFKEFIYVR